jgi:glycosyltransferase involved in cell wall biosynthesis
MELNKSQVYITIPLYNDAKMILKVIKSLKDKGYNNIVVVDDGSKDNGYDVVKKNTDVIVTKHIINRGQGAALQTAMEIAIEQGAKYIVHFDSDGQHDIHNGLRGMNDSGIIVNLSDELSTSVNLNKIPKWTKKL